MNNKKLRRIMKFWAVEINIEFKACLYFFAFLFYYCSYRRLCGIYNGLSIHMLEMILSTYAMGYIQVYLLGNFDESDRLGVKEAACILLCTGLYMGAAQIFGWFGGDFAPLLGFGGYAVLTYSCALLVYKIRREFDGRALNRDLERFKERQKNDK